MGGEGGSRSPGGSPDGRAAAQTTTWVPELGYSLLCPPLHSQAPPAVLKQGGHLTSPAGPGGEAWPWVSKALRPLARRVCSVGWRPPLLTLDSLLPELLLLQGTGQGCSQPSRQEGPKGAACLRSSPQPPLNQQGRSREFILLPESPDSTGEAARRSQDPCPHGALVFSSAKRA